ncbi:MAG TPA: ribonuclease H-like domain-containing protein, partial [Methanomicrobiales archaeon]|nr:ribonuclease H-like domain-containing protein [Methanomicrobiales archaeon]
RRWQERIDRLQEYAVIRDGNIFHTSISDSFLFESAYQKARSLKDELLRDYAGMALEEAFSGEVMETGLGTCYHLTSSDNETVRLPEPRDLRQDLLYDLTLVRGVGPITEKRLRGRGYRTIADLQSHPRFRDDARACLRHLDGGDLTTLQQWMGQRYPKAHHRMLDISQMADAGSLVFLDLETLGLFSRPIILFGVGRLGRGTLTVHQYLLRDISEEPAALEAALSHLEGEGAALVTFNGKTFDLPYLQDRAAYYGQPLIATWPHFDILHFSRRRWKGNLPDCRLTTLERSIFNRCRENDVPSQMVPEFYETYRRTGNPGPLVPIVEHNRQDVITLAHLYAHLLEQGNAGG